MAKAWYGGEWYRAAGGGVEARCDPADPAEIARVVDPIREQLSREITPGIRALDLGCFAGRFTFAMEQMGALATGLDCVGPVLEYSRRLAAQWGSKCTFVEGDFDHLPFGPGTFDLVLFPSNIVEASYGQMERLVEQLATILAPGGKFCILMRDGLLRALERSKLNCYDAATGIVGGTSEALGHEAVQVDTCFWTVGFARHVIGRRFRMLRCEATKDGAYWLVFANGR
jgi:SAM-dependent methyltransferase